jgi:hypothetical protein
MSRKAKEVALARSAGVYTEPGCLLASLGYSQIKATKLPSDVAIVLWLPEAEVEPRSEALVERLRTFLLPIQRLLMNTDAPASPPTAIFVVDCTPLIKAGDNVRSIVDAEAAADGQGLGKRYGKPVARFLEKLLAGYKGNLSLVAFEGGAQLALRLLQATPQDHGFKPGLAKRLVLVRPRLSAAGVNAMLTKPVETKTSVDIFYESAAALEKREVMVRHAYARGTSLVLAAAATGAHSVGAQLYVSLLSSGSESPVNTEAEVALADPEFETIDLMGQRVFWSELSFVMNKDTKQPEAALSDLDSYEIAKATALTTARSHADTTLPAAPQQGSAEAGPFVAMHPSTESTTKWVGAFILRGNRCVLVRSLASPPTWTGLRIPFVERRAGESALDGAVRAASGRSPMCDSTCCRICRTRSAASQPRAPLPDQLEPASGYRTLRYRRSCRA